MKLNLYKTIGLSAALASAAFANDALPVAQQNALVKKYCAVCHTDAIPNGGLSLQQYAAARPDPGVAAMILSKLHSGAMGAAGIGVPEKPIQEAWINATTAQAAGADRWNIHRTSSTFAADIVREVPGRADQNVPDSYRLIVSCRADTREGKVQLAWSPNTPKFGQIMSASVDGGSPSTYKLEGKEKMGNGQDGASGPGAIYLSPALPTETLTIRDVIPNETIVFPLADLSQTDRQSLAPCFPGGAGFSLQPRL